MKEIAPAWIPFIVGTPVNAVQYPPEIATIFREDGPVLLIWIPEPDRSSDHRANETFKLPLRAGIPEMASGVDFFYPAREWSRSLNRKVLQQLPERMNVQNAFAEVFQNNMGHSQPVRCIGIRAFRYCDLHPAVKNRCHTFKLSPRECGVLSGELEKELHYKIIGLQRRNTCGTGNTHR
jgi:hypothetical protein